ncbi:HAD superfamily hydrolase (TIGR01509 family)/HAD superfamily hydrolase (TIGR01549 family) [Frondihabitans sp. PhB188]|uniref:HAD family hydrolase n=1 Tax=Frondihabitans sp. PhB188 TaxID=2485200 RepID=UPI000F497262|nr:HAD family hydrolase [Frondihabitans sp. PhB188]ROQ40708.1 HAD superfamily hydrolase (TIGR01509 family)/HAD superfamily hydrolase (TIGR01549 family) [Frondihabitans sp. PhB188]
MSTEPATAVLFDIDGTLVSSNFLHVDAWNAAFSDLDLAVPSWRIQSAIGADGSELLEQLIPGESDEVRSRASELHAEHYQGLAPRLQLLPGARDLLRALSDRGCRVVLATSAPQQELEILLELLDADEFVYAVTSSEDVETAKPAPDIVSVALERSGADTDRAIMVGDAVWDCKAAAAAGLAAIAVRSGGTGRAELVEAGAVAVYDDTAALLADIDESPLRGLTDASRG